MWWGPSGLCEKGLKGTGESASGGRRGAGNAAGMLHAVEGGKTTCGGRVCQCARRV
jgi:hypothetical protein